MDDGKLLDLSALPRFVTVEVVEVPPVRPSKDPTHALKLLGSPAGVCAQAVIVTG